MLQIGSRVGPYEILAPLDLGTTEAYRAYDHERHCHVTLGVRDINADGHAAYVISEAPPDGTRRAGWQAILRRRWGWTVAGAVVVAAIVGIVLSKLPDAAPNEPSGPTAATATAAPNAPQQEHDTAATVKGPMASLQIMTPVADGPAVLAADDTGRTDAAATLPPSPTRVAVDANRSAPPLPAASARPLTSVHAGGRDAPGLMAEASVRATEFDLAGAVELAMAAAHGGDSTAQVAVLYLRGLIDAREAFREGGPPDALAPVREAIASLHAQAKGRPGAGEIARLVLHAAAAAAQSERDEMGLYLEAALAMEALQRMAGLPGAPLVSAAEVAGDLWLQVHRYEDARRAYTEAAASAESTLRILSGLARAARRLNDAAAACANYRQLLDAWGGRPGLPVEIAEARAYLGGCAP